MNHMNPMNALRTTSRPRWLDPEVSSLSSMPISSRCESHSEIRTERKFEYRCVGAGLVKLLGRLHCDQATYPWDLMLGLLSYLVASLILRRAAATYVLERHRLNRILMDLSRRVPVSFVATKR